MMFCSTLPSHQEIFVQLIATSKRGPRNFPLTARTCPQNTYHSIIRLNKAHFATNNSSITFSAVRFKNIYKTVPSNVTPVTNQTLSTKDLIYSNMNQISSS